MKYRLIAAGLAASILACGVASATAAPYAPASHSKLINWYTKIPDASQVDVPAYPGSIAIDSASRVCARAASGMLQCPALSLPYVVLVTKAPESKVLAFYRRHLAGGWSPVAKALSEKTHIWSFNGPELTLADKKTYSELLDIEPVGKALSSDERQAYMPGARTWIKITYVPRAMREARDPATVDYPPANVSDGSD